jgi:endonuclease YncB( thermonuclease family)
MRATISNTDDVIDSRDVIARIEELESDRQDLMDAETALQEWDDDDGRELAALRKLAEDGESSPDWSYGESLISEGYFTKYIEELIDDCYEMPKEMNSGEWPWRHVTIDYDAAADEAKQDYKELDFDGNTYFIRR